MNEKAEAAERVRRKFWHAVVRHKELKNKVKAYFRTRPLAAYEIPGDSSTSNNFLIRGKSPTPARIALVAGDYLQNLRSTLDYLVWELVQLNGGSPSHENMFPITHSQDAFNQAIARRRLLGVQAEAIAIIADVQPFSVSPSAPSYTGLALLDQLTNVNKHRRVFITTLGVVTGVSEANIPDLEPVPQFEMKPGKEHFVLGEPCQLQAALVMKEQGIEGVDLLAFTERLGGFVLHRLFPRFDDLFDNFLVKRAI